MEDSNANQATSPSPITNCQSPTARRSTGPRTAEGKRRSCQNARKHGLYTDERFLQGAALELGDDPRHFQRLLKGLVQARRPVGALEMALVEGIALLLSKTARLDRSELAVQVSNLHHRIFKKIKNRGNELKDLLQRQGITEIATSKRTHFRAEKAAIDAQRNGVSRIVRARRPLSGAILREPG